MIDSQTHEANQIWLRTTRVRCDFHFPSGSGIVGVFLQGMANLLSDHTGTTHPRRWTLFERSARLSATTITPFQDDSTTDEHRRGIQQ